jgi:hypothetical protein
MAIAGAAECEARARECARLARSAETYQERDILYAMSRNWESLARQTARYEQITDEKTREH